MHSDEDPELVGEFKNAATAVTKLFKIASSNRQEAYRQGYMDALRHLLDQLEADEHTNPQQWAVHQLTGITQNSPDTIQVGDKRGNFYSARKRYRYDHDPENPDML